MTKNFQELAILPSINTSDHDFSEDFFIPLLRRSKFYDRGVGFFSSGWLKINSSGLVGFAENGGKGRWITSPILDENDWEALKIGNAAKQDELLRAVLRKNIDNLITSLERDTLSALAWMVADGILEFKLAVLRKKLDGEFHDKFGIFTDQENNKISFNGSYNESIQGTRNYESFKIFKSWNIEQAHWVQDDTARFERLWNNEDSNVRLLDIGAANRENILKLRLFSRPYDLKTKKLSPTGDNKQPDNDGSEKIALRDYQLKAIQAWFDNKCTGFFEMATGTGKTITALAAVKKLYNTEGRLAIIVTVPYQHLVDQWKVESKKFGFNNIILAYKEKKLWINKLNKSIVEYNNGFRNFFCVLTTHTTFRDSDFQRSVKRIKFSACVIADEAHHLGAEIAQKAYPQNISFRLALSATPNRWFDDLGTQALRGYFGKTVFEFSLKEAIGISLTQYYYFPVLVDLTATELALYQNYTLKIAQIFRDTKPVSGESKLKLLLLKRAEILNKAQNKIHVLSDLLDKSSSITHTLFFCAPGQMDEIIHLVGKEKGCLLHSFTSREDNEVRKQLLADFASGKLQALVAIKCLDEGVDVPTTETAYLLASTSNPREFIQRRGRILRKAEGKQYSYLYDLITVPPDNSFFEHNEAVFNIEKNIVGKELSRFKEFAEYAQNKHAAIDVIWEIAKRYHLMDF